MPLELDSLPVFHKMGFFAINTCNKEGFIMSNETKKVNLELEIDTNVTNSSHNPFQKLIHLARAVDAWRIWPRAFLTVYIYLVYKVVDWFMTLDAPTMEQSGLLSIIVGAGAAWFGLYVNSGPGKSGKD